jgi:hypothetical protein
VRSGTELNVNSSLAVTLQANVGSVDMNPTSQPSDIEGPFGAAQPAEDDFKKLLLDTLDRIGCGGLILDHNNRIIGNNQVAVAILKRRSKLPTDNFDVMTAVKALLRSMEPAPGEAATWVSAWEGLDHPLAIFPVPSGDSLVLIIVDIGISFPPKATMLRRMFRIPSADSGLACGIALGLSPAVLAETLGAEKTTARPRIQQDKDRQAS